MKKRLAFVLQIALFLMGSLLIPQEANAQYCSYRGNAYRSYPYQYGYRNLGRQSSYGRGFRFGRTINRIRYGIPYSYSRRFR
jgi:hypothetical protein